MKMKLKISKVIFYISVLCFLSCTDHFESLNKDPLKSESMNPGYLFTYGQLRTAGERYEAWRANMIFSSCIAQQFSSVFGYWQGDKYNSSIESYLSAYWESNYPTTIKAYTDIIKNLKKTPKDSAKNVNKIFQATIMNIFVFHRVTDLYGDVPYTEASKGYTDGIIFPKYDKQEFIYKDMIKKLKKASSSFSEKESLFTDSDLLYGGDMAKWKKFANSLLLRLAMRVSGKDGGAAVKDAIAHASSNGGFIKTKDEIAWVNQTDGPEGVNRNANSKVFDAENNMRISKTFSDYLIETKDPRLFVYAAVYEEDDKGKKQIGGKDFNNYKNALPNGTVSTNPIWSKRKDNPLVQVNRKYMAKMDNPTFLINSAEVYFLLAEAAVRGWGGGSAKDNYENGVKEGMKYLSLYDAGAAIDDKKIDEYLKNNPFKSGKADQIKQIAKQKWVANFMNFYESFADLRRLDFLDFKAVYVKDVTKVEKGKFFRRFKYPQREANSNNTNYKAAVGALEGGDKIGSRVWWDKGKSY